MAEPVLTFRPAVGLRAVIAGVGSTRAQLAAELAAQSASRPLVVCGSNVARSSALTVIRDTLGDVPVFSGSKPHTPAATIDRGARKAREVGADALVVVGGSSAVDCAKGIAVLLQEGKESVRELEPAVFGRLAEVRDARQQRPFPVVCVPTTLSMAEFQPFFGARDDEKRRKNPYLDHGLVARTIFLDGQVAAATPGHLWAETGVKCLDDALSRYCATVAEPVADAPLEHAIEMLFGQLGPSSAAADPVARQQIFDAAWLTGFAFPRFRQSPPRRPWFSTTARHALGGACELPHGVGSCIALLPGLRFHYPATRDRQDQLADRLRNTTLADAVAALVGELGVPTRLGALGVAEAVVTDVVANMLHEAPTLAPPDELEALCRALW